MVPTVDVKHVHAFFRNIYKIYNNYNFYNDYFKSVSQKYQVENQTKYQLTGLILATHHIIIPLLRDFYLKVNIMYLIFNI